MSTATIADLRREIGKYLSIPEEDLDLIDFCLAVFISQQIPGDPLWGMIVDASGGGKTELLRSFRGHPDAYFLSKLTEKSLISGYRDPDEKGKDPSLLPELDGKILIVKDLAPILEMRRETRNKILADFRDAYDGFTDNAVGNLGRVCYQARFTFLIACTLAVERYQSVEQELGERMVRFRACGQANLTKAQSAVRGIGRDDSMREEMQRAIRNFLSAVPVPSSQVPESLIDPLARVSDFTARARSYVARDRQGDLQYHPRPEVGTRLGKELGKLLLALAAVRGKPEPDKEDFATVCRVADDCIPPNRLAVIRVLREGGAPAAEIEEATRMPHKTVQRILDDLQELGLATGTGDPKQLVWNLIID